MSALSQPRSPEHVSQTEHSGNTKRSGNTARSGYTAHSAKTERSAPRPSGTKQPTVPLWREAVGAVLRSERQDLGRRLVDVAGDAGVSPQYLSEVERGLKDPSSEMLAAISGAVGLDLGTVAGLAAARVRAAEARLAGALILNLRTELTPARRSAPDGAVHQHQTPSGIWSVHGASATAASTTMYRLAA